MALFDAQTLQGFADLAENLAFDKTVQIKRAPKGTRTKGAQGSSIANFANVGNPILCMAIQDKETNDVESVLDKQVIATHWIIKFKRDANVLVGDIAVSTDGFTYYLSKPKAGKGKSFSVLLEFYALRFETGE